MFKRIFPFLGFLLILSILACAAKQKAKPPTIRDFPELGAGKPRWVERRPDNPLLYQGVGSSMEDRQKADDRAFADLAKEIKVEVHSVVIDIIKAKRTEEQVEMEEMFTSEIQTIANETLEGARIVERWSDPSTGEYWAYAILEKELVRQKIEKQLADAKKLALDHYYSARDALMRGEMSFAFKYFLNSLLALRTFLGQPVEVDLDGDGTQEMFNSEIEREIGRILTSIDLIAENQNLVGRKGRPPKAPLTVRVVHTSDKGEIPLSDLPIAFRFVRGSGKLDESSLSNSSGLAYCRVYEVAPSSVTNVVEASLDLKALVGTDRDLSQESMDQILGLLDRLGIPTCKFNISIKPMTFMVRVEERNIGQLMSESFVEEELIKRLLEAGFAVVPKSESVEILRIPDVEGIMGGDLSVAERAGRKAQADIVIVGTADAKYSQTVFGMISCHARATVKAVDVERLEIVASEDISDKGFDDDREEQAGEKALKKAAERIADSIIGQLEEMK